MKLTSKASDYALLLVLHLAKQPSDELTNVKRVAEELTISLKFLATIAGRLVAARLVRSQRGSHGGIELARSPAEISVGQVIEAIDGPLQTMFCQNTDEVCSHNDACGMKHFWNDIQYTVTHKLFSTSLAEILSQQPAERLNV